MITDFETENVDPVEGLKAFAKFYCRSAKWGVVRHNFQYLASFEPKPGCRINYSADHAKKNGTWKISCTVHVTPPKGKTSNQYTLPLNLYSGIEAKQVFEEVEQQCSGQIASNILNEINNLKE